MCGPERVYGANRRARPHRQMTLAQVAQCNEADGRLSLARGVGARLAGSVLQGRDVCGLKRRRLPAVRFRRGSGRSRKGLSRVTARDQQRARQDVLRPPGLAETRDPRSRWRRGSGLVRKFLRQERSSQGLRRSTPTRTKLRRGSPPSEVGAQHPLRPARGPRAGRRTRLLALRDECRTRCCSRLSAEARRRGRRSRVENHMKRRSPFTGRSTPTMRATSTDQTPAVQITISVAIRPWTVSTATIRPPLTWIPVAAHPTRIAPPELDA